MFDDAREDPITEVPFGLTGRVFRGAMPYSLFDPQGRVLDAAAHAGVDVVVLLAGAAECLAQTDRDLAALYGARGWTVLEIPITDQGVPGRSMTGLFRQRVLEVHGLAERGRHVLVHCLAGVGRTGMFLACLARVIRGLEPDAAIEWVRESVPRAVEREEQRRFVTSAQL